MLLAVETDRADLGEWEWVEEGKPYREWLIPRTWRTIGPSRRLRIRADSGQIVAA